MTQSRPPRPQSGMYIGDARLAQMRIGSGLVLFTYVCFHLINHALGLISVEAMEAANHYMRAFMRWLPVTVVFYGALLLHFYSAMLRVYRRRTLRMPVTEWVQLGMGVAIPFLLVVHVMGTRYTHEVYELNDSYTYVLLSTFVFSTFAGWLNAAGLIAAWVHGCIGLHMWAQMKKWYGPRVHQVALVLAGLMPAFSLAGYLSAGRSVAPLASDGEFMGAYYEALNLKDDAVFDLIARDTDYVRWGILVIIVGVVGARLIRKAVQRRRNEITIEYVDGPTVRTPMGFSLLEMSRAMSVPHASVCGGKGRCSTCRVRVLAQDIPSDPPSEGELKVLTRVRAADDVRLACQFMPLGNLKVARLLPSDTTLAHAETLAPWSTGRERTVTVMFADLRDFTRTAEARLPFDVVYLINQFSRHMGLAVEEHNGRIDKFLGDGFMAIFGLEGTQEEACRDALAAAQAMVRELDTLNVRLRNDLDKPLRMGIGIHTGSVVLGDMGFGPARGLTAIGDVVNIASRLESATKTEASAMCVSAHTVQLAGLKLPDANLRTIEVRGKSEKLDIYAVDDELARHMFEQSTNAKEVLA